MSPVKVEVFEFEDFRLEIASRRLLKSGVPVPLESLPFGFLVCLVQNAGQLVSKADFINEIWGGTPIGDGPISVAARKVRIALSDDLKNPKFVRNISGVGYIFICDVKKSYALNLPAPGSLTDFDREEFVRELNRIPDVKVHGILSGVPTIQINDDYKLDSKYRSQVKRCHETLTEDETQAVSETVPDLDSVPAIFKAKKLRYSGVKVLRSYGKNPYVLSSNAVLVCPERNLLIVDLRSSATDTYSSKFHTLGGAFEVQKDGVSFKTTMIREIAEESGVPTSHHHEVPILVSEEISTKFLQIVFLGAIVHESELPHLTASWESEKLVKLPFDKLEEYLVNEEVYSWVPTGKAHILAWLAFGAPGCNGKASFNGRRPEQLFLDVMATI